MLVFIFQFLLYLLHCSADETLGLADSDIHDPGADLLSYVSRPDIRAPRFEIEILNQELVTPGYWFTAPYGNLESSPKGQAYYPAQAGPHIYDNYGELVWSGAHMTKNRNAYDFKPVVLPNGTTVLTFIFDQQKRSSWHPDPVGFVMDASYETNVAISLVERYNMHEFNLINPQTVLIVDRKNRVVPLKSLGYEGEKASVIDSGFYVVDIPSGNTTFSWHPSDHISLTEVQVKEPSDLHNGDNAEAWDCYHTNSVDVLPDSNYLLSVRHTSTIYKISSTDGSIIWRLGGVTSDFRQNFNFSSQHHVRSQPSAETGVTLITIFDNASSNEHGGQEDTSTSSSMKIVALYEHEKPMRAELVKEYYRPDGKLTRLRGAANILPNGGAYVGWSDRGYISEHSSDGSVVLAARWAGYRFNTYRSYKAPFVGHPSESPSLITRAYGREAYTGNPKDLTSTSTVFYVSWNGATEVRNWTFYGSNDLSKEYVRLGSTQRMGFETSFISYFFWAFSYAEAFDANGKSLGKSEVQTTVLTSANGLGFASNVAEIGLNADKLLDEDTDEFKTKIVTETVQAPADATTVLSVVTSVVYKTVSVEVSITAPASTPSASSKASASAELDGGGIDNLVTIQAPKSIIAMLIILITGVLVGGIVTLTLRVWRKISEYLGTGSGGQAYLPVHDEDNDVEEGEIMARPSKSSLEYRRVSAEERASLVVSVSEPEDESAREMDKDGEGPMHSSSASGMGRKHVRHRSRASISGPLKM